MQFILFWFKITNLETYLEYMSLVCRYAEFAQYEVDTVDQLFKFFGNSTK